ncbi:MAG: hypothetical protein Metus_1458 [Candidatus Methanosuratincola subterraneus]|uniref:Uncharacterized protein n=1 Tax=Methanosuratincola subterraneus TaxID=2593994 RepID=A0A3S3VCE6_METS7|nr:MAG: hypothetical protein Metus_1458 [Candidatus Methanosuratincola subterraneus]
MVRLIDLDVSGASLAARLALGAILGGLAFLVFYYVPANLLGIASNLAGVEIPPQAAGVISSLIEPALPSVGLALAPAIFLCALFRGTKAYGPLTIALSLIFAAYVFLFFHGGAISVAAPVDQLVGGLPMELSLSIRVDMAMLMALFLVPPALGVAKGVLLMMKMD